MYIKLKRIVGLHQVMYQLKVLNEDISSGIDLPVQTIINHKL